jgi:hypothetical protein
MAVGPSGWRRQNLRRLPGSQPRRTLQLRFVRIENRWLSK